ncbi:MAG: hypothetical protein LHV68_11740 [Elusimicrobia bacterium]|nr:hypothetical protein [Candidatus Liberimonas magnetica]
MPGGGGTSTEADILICLFNLFAQDQASTMEIIHATVRRMENHFILPSFGMVNLDGLMDSKFAISEAYDEAIVIRGTAMEMKSIIVITMNIKPLA